MILYRDAETVAGIMGWGGCWGCEQRALFCILYQLFRYQNEEY